MRKSTTVASLIVVLVAVLAFQPVNAAVPTDTADLREAVTVDGVMEHLEAFQDIADDHDGNRASGSSGYDASADYVFGLLKDAGYTVTRQDFDFAFFSEVAPSEFERVSPDAYTYTSEEFTIMEYAGSDDVTAAVTAVDVVVPIGSNAANTSTSGCEAADFDGFMAGDIALLQRGTCSFAQKAINAEDAGAAGVIIFNEGQAGREDLLNGTLGGPESTIPVIGTTYDVGAELVDLSRAGETMVRLFTETTSEIRSTENVIADSATGRTDRVVVVGAHLDSVPEGPGINDNGTGSAAILEIALQMADADLTNQVRFAFWGAEESGLVGSEHYVSQLSKREIKNIAVNLNFDMVGSPNYVRFVYDGDGSSTPVAGPTGSGNVEDVFVDYFTSQSLASEPTEFSGRSDYGPFIAVGIPAGGLFTGAEGAKTEAQADEYGGLSEFDGEPVSYDPCYHQECDTLEENTTALFDDLRASYGEDVIVGNVNTQALDEMSDAAAHAVLTFAETTSDVSGTAKASDKVKASALDYDGHHARR